MSTHFGIELEISNRPFGIHWHNAEARMYTVAKKHWTEAFGASRILNCGTDHCGYEFRTPKTESTAANVAKIEKWIQGIFSETTKRDFPNADRLFHGQTGMHVHIDVQTLNKRARNLMFKTFFMFEPRILECVHISRTRNRWCTSIRSRLNRDGYHLTDINTKDFSSQRGSWDNRNPLSRYWCTSGVCLNDHYPTVEVRYGRGTLDAEDVTNWLMLLLIIVENAKNARTFDVPFTASGRVKKQAESKAEFVRFIEGAKISDDMRWLKDKREDVARWAKKKMAERGARTRRAA